MIDVILVAATIGFFFANIAFIAGCDRLMTMGRGQ